MKKSVLSRPTYIFLSTTAILVLLGLAVMASSSVPLSQKNFGQSFYYLRHQLIFGLGLGLVALVIAWRVNLRVWRSAATPLFLASLLLLVLVFAPPVGYSAGGANRWIAIAGVSFQPSELIKLTLIVFLARWLESKKDKVKKASSAVPLLFWLAVAAALVALEPDFDTVLLLAVVGLTMYFSAGARFKIVAAVLMLVLIIFSVSVGLWPHTRQRVLSFLNPGVDLSDQGYQINQALIAVGSGGFFGRGLGHGVQKYNYLPESIGDTVFAIIAEELGFVRAAAVLVVFLIWILSVLKIAARSPTLFGRYIGVGVAGWIGWQTFINILGVLGLIPFSGIPLPFISYGGSALMIELAAVGLVLNITSRAG